MYLLVKSYDLDELVDFPDAVAVGAELPELETHLALGLGAVRAHTRGVVVTAWKYFDNDNILVTTFISPMTLGVRSPLSVSYNCSSRYSTSSAILLQYPVRWSYLQIKIKKITECEMKCYQ